MISRVAASVSTRHFLEESTALAAWPPPQKVNPIDQHDLHSAKVLFFSSQKYRVYKKLTFSREDISIYSLSY